MLNDRPARTIVSIAILGACIASLPAEAQTIDLNPGQVEVTRAELDSLLARYEETAASTAYSGALRERARTDAMLIRRRIEIGDFQVGDQITLLVEGEPTLSAVFTVQAGPSITLPTIGGITLVGVLRSELESHLRTELRRYLRDPVVQARASIRLLITGDVLRAGYHVLPTNIVFSDVLTTAGGVTANADLERIRVERGDQVIWEASALQRAIIEGRTLDQLSIQAGDHVVVPQRRESTAGSAARVATTIVAPIILLIVTLVQVL